MNTFVATSKQASNVMSLLCCSPHTRCTADQAPYMHLFGDTHLTEMLEDFKFEVSPDSFFQVNTAAAAVLYKTVMHLAGLTHLTTLLDVCCGTGQFVTVLSFFFEHVYRLYLNQVGKTTCVFRFIAKPLHKAALSLHPHVMA